MVLMSAMLVRAGYCQLIVPAYNNKIITSLTVYQPLSVSTSTRTRDYAPSHTNCRPHTTVRSKVMSRTNSGYNHLTPVPTQTLGPQTAPPDSCPGSYPWGFSHGCSSTLLYESLLLVPDVWGCSRVMSMPVVTLVRSTGTATLHFNCETLVPPIGRLSDALYSHQQVSAEKRGR